MIKVAPTATGIITNSNDFAPRIAIIGLAPAGGWRVLVIIIINIAKNKLKAIAKEESPIKLNIKTPEAAEKICPKKIFFGCANLLSWTAITRTKLAPNGGINHMFDASIEFKNEISNIHKKAPNEDMKIFL